MSNLQVRNIPDELHERLRLHARKKGVTISATVIAAIERELARLEWDEDFATRPNANLGTKVSVLLVEERARHEGERK